MGFPGNISARFHKQAETKSISGGLVFSDSVENAEFKVEASQRAAEFSDCFCSRPAYDLTPDRGPAIEPENHGGMTMRVLVMAAMLLECLCNAEYAQAGFEKSNIPKVLVGAAKRVSLYDVLTYPARVEPKVNANILSETDGVVTKVLTPLGTKVAARARLFVLKHTDPVYQYAPVIVTAPVAGVISQVDVSEGTLVTKGQRLATVTDPSRIRIAIEAAAADLAMLHPGLEGKLKINGRDDVTVRVRGISPFVDPATGTATCQLDAESAVAPGLVGQVIFQVNERQGFTLPEHAVVYRGANTFLRVVEAAKAKYVPVTLGKRSRGSIEILKGLSEGAQVIERASAFIADGEQVEAEGAKL